MRPDGFFEKNDGEEVKEKRDDGIEAGEESKDDAEADEDLRKAGTQRNEKRV